MLQTLPYASLTLAGYAYFFGVALIFLNTSTSAVTAEDWAMTGWSVGAILFAGVFASFFNYTVMAWVNNRVGPLLVMVFYPVQSFATPLLNFLIFGTVISAEEALGGAVICGGLACVLWAKYREGSPATGAVEVDDATAEAATLVLTQRDVEELAAAAQTGDAASAQVLLPIIERTFSRRAIGGGAGAMTGADEESALLKESTKEGTPRARSATVSSLLSSVTGVRKRLPRERSVVVAML